MRNKTLFTVSATVFILVAMMHLYRIVMNGSANLMGWQVPMWASYLGIALAGILAYLHILAASQER